MWNSPLLPTALTAPNTHRPTDCGDCPRRTMAWDAGRTRRMHPKCPSNARERPARTILTRILRLARHRNPQGSGSSDDPQPYTPKGRTLFRRGVLPLPVAVRCCAGIQWTGLWRCRSREIPLHRFHGHCSCRLCRWRQAGATAGLPGSCSLSRPGSSPA